MIGSLVSDGEAADLLPELSSPFDSSPERVAAYFSATLRSRIASSFLSAYHLLSTPHLHHKISAAFQAYNSMTSTGTLLQTGGGFNFGGRVVHLFSPVGFNFGDLFNFGDHV